MPAGQVPARYFDILESTTLGHLATVNAEGRPEVNPVWFLWDGGVPSCNLGIPPV